MTNKEQFRGVWTALVTPFDNNGNIDYDAIDILIEKQIEGEVKGILFLGTTGECPTISHDEGMELVKRAITKINNRCKVMVNIGTYSTDQSIQNLKSFQKIEGIDAFLAVNPYYSKPTQNGLYLHFKSIADNSNLPLFLYNIQGRTGVNLETDTLVKLSENCNNIIGVKEASGNINQMREVIRNTHDDFLVLSGDDSITLELIKNGGDGVISVASNLLAKEVVDLVGIAIDSNFEKANVINNYLQEFFEQEFIQTNPLPIKTALAHIGLIQEEFRLPMCNMDSTPRDTWLEIVDRYMKE